MSETTRPLALVTGASSGIGASYASALARRGFDLVLVARRADRLRSVADDLAKLGATATPLVADLGRPEGIARAAEACRQRPLELLVNNAGVAHYMPFATLPPERADEIVLVNTMAVVSLSRAAIGGRALHAAATAQGIPAIIGRHRRSPYLPGVRSRLWRLVPATAESTAGPRALAAEPTPAGAGPILALIQRLPFEDAD